MVNVSEKSLHATMTEQATCSGAELVSPRIRTPSPALVPRSRNSSSPNLHEEDRDRFEAEELDTLDVDRQSLPRLSHVITPNRPVLHWYEHLFKVWRHTVRINVPHADCRDHLANERTFLAYLRTSLAISMLGITVAQLYRLDGHPSAVLPLGYFVLALPLSVVLQSSALAVILLGATRFLRQQNAMAIGNVRAGGWELVGVMGLTLSITLALFAVHMAVAVYEHFAPSSLE